MKYVQIAVLLGVLAGAFALKMLWDSNQELRADNAIKEAQIENNKADLVLLTKLLKTEEKNREAAQQALSELAKDVPDEVYREELPPSVQKVLDNFQSSIRNRNP